MIAKLFEVRDTVNCGRGLFAREFIPKGTIVWFECDKCRVLTAEEIEFDQMTGAEKEKVLDYAYRKEDGTFLAPCDEARYLNHSCNANILGTELGFDIVVRDIKKREEATYDYRDFYDEISMSCHCGEANCCGIVTFVHPVPEDLKVFWDEKINEALKYVNAVDQPLEESLKQIGVYLPLTIGKTK